MSKPTKAEAEQALRDRVENLDRPSPEDRAEQIARDLAERGPR